MANLHVIGRYVRTDDKVYAHTQTRRRDARGWLIIYAEGFQCNNLIISNELSITVGQSCLGSLTVANMYVLCFEASFEAVF